MTSDEKRQRHKDGHRSRMEAARIAQARAVRRQRLVALAAVVAFAVVVGAAAFALWGDDGDDAAADASTTVPTLPTDSSDPSAAPTTVALPPPPEGAAIEGETPCPAEGGSEERVSSFAQPPPTCIDPDEALEAVIETSAGPITVALDAEAAPTMVNNFVVLARYRYFDGLPFHRLVPDFVAQTGSSGVPDYGSGGPGYDMPDVEKPDDGYVAGDVAMARSDAVSGSQFFIVASDAGGEGLTNDYPRVGRVVEGQELVSELAAKGDPAGGAGTPTEVVTITSVTIRPAGG